MTCSTSWKSTQVKRNFFGGRIGEAALTCRGHRAWATFAPSWCGGIPNVLLIHIWREVSGTREAHTGSLLCSVVTRALPYNRKGGGRVTEWESDSLIVLGDRESLLHVSRDRRHGEEVDEHA